MRSFGERVQRIAGVLACWTMLAGAAMAQQNKGAMAQQNGDVPRPDLITNPECWPPPCWSPSCDECDLIRSRCPNKCDYILFPPRLGWYFAADGGGLVRQLTREVNFAAAANLTNTVLSTRDLDADFKMAGHFLVGHSLNECFQIEGVFTGVAAADNTATVRNTTRNSLGGQGILSSPFGGFGSSAVSGLDFNDFAQIHYHSSLRGAELNIRRQVPMPPDRLMASVIFGVRYLDLPEGFDYLTHSNAPTPGGARNTIHVATDNQMVGPQIGTLFEMYIDNRWWMNFEAKAAVLNNRARQSTLFNNVSHTAFAGEFAFSDHGDHTAFAGELDLTFVYRWSPGLITRLGYQALFMSGVALATENLGTSITLLTQGPAQLNHDGSILYHGPYAGIEFGW